MCIAAPLTHADDIVGVGGAIHRHECWRALGHELVITILGRLQLIFHEHPISELENNAVDLAGELRECKPEILCSCHLCGLFQSCHDEYFLGLGIWMFDCGTRRYEVPEISDILVFAL